MHPQAIDGPIRLQLDGIGATGPYRLTHQRIAGGLTAIAVMPQYRRADPRGPATPRRVTAQLDLRSRRSLPINPGEDERIRQRHW